MDIHSIFIKHYNVSESTFTEDRLFHKKSLPLLSVVQATEGYYSIKLDNGMEYQTGKMGVFIAPPGKMQYITHHVDELTKSMRSHWIFMDIIINNAYRISDLYDFPVLLPTQWQNEACNILRNIIASDHICDNLSVIYKLIKILLEIGAPKRTHDRNEHLMAEIENYTQTHFAEKITAVQLAEHFAVSLPGLYRIFKRLFNQSPANYINDIRLANAVLLLETTDLPISSISQKIGIEDAFYFSRLFKAKYEISPSAFRKQIMGISATD